ncbi:MAG TPA: hypothetical protein VIR63_06795 [Pontiella sp.]
MNIQDWLKKRMIAASAYDADVLLKDFLSEMESGLRGEESSLAMIPTYINIEGPVPIDKPVAVIDVGGTNIRTCIARFDNSGTVSLSRISRFPMPGRDREISAAEFYDVLVGALCPLKDEFERIGFCFSYPVVMTPELDGRLLYWSKEIKIPELVGSLVGEGLVEALEERGVYGKKVVLLNDTVATLVAGCAHGQGFNASSYIGFILGTGTNTAYVERNDLVGKLTLNSGSQVINVESGSFSIFRRGPQDLALDECSENPGQHVFEKMISGAYQGPLSLELLQSLIPEGVFSDSGAAALAVMSDLPTVLISNLTSGNKEDIGVLGEVCFSDADREIIKTVFVSVVERAALLTAVNIMACVVKSNAGASPLHPLCINIDGSTYYKTYRMNELVQAHLGRMLKARGLHARCIKIEEAPMVGAAIAALTARWATP